jgi:hypothetical protein
MSETMTTYEHLNALDQHRGPVQSMMEQVHHLHPEGLQPLWDIEQPVAQRSIHDIAKFSEIAHRDLEIGASYDAVWQKSLEIAGHYVVAAQARVENDPTSTDAQNDARESVESTVVMAALDRVNSSEDGVGIVDILSILREKGFGRQIDDAIERTVEEGLVIRNAADEFIPVSRLVGASIEPELFNVASDAAVEKHKAPQSLGVDAMIKIIEEMRTSLYGMRGDLYKERVAEYRELSATIDWDGLTIDDADRLIYEMTFFDHERENIVGVEHRDVQLGMTAGELRSHVSEETLSRLYKTEIDGRQSSLSKFLNNNTLTSEKSRYNAEILAKIYREFGGLDKVKVGEDPAVDRIRSFIDEAEITILSIPEKPKDQTQEAIAVFNDEVAYRIRETFGNMGLERGSKGAAADFYYAAYGRLMGEDEETSSYFDGKKVARKLSRIKRNVDTVGVEIVERLRKDMGVVNLDKYDSSALENLNKLLDGTPSFIEQLQSGDVTVIFVDAWGDHNGAFEPILNDYRKMHGRTLMFEVGSPGDFYRRMALLKRLGIKPSTLVIGAHGSPGSTHFGGGLNGFNLVASSSDSGQKTSEESIFLDQTRIDRLVSDEFMQSPKGIDSPDETKGRRQIIIASCSSDKEFESAKTTATVIAERIGRNDTDVYGARDVTSFERVFDKNGQRSIRFNKWEKDSSVTDKKTSVASKISLVAKRDRLGRKSGDLKIKRTLIDSIPTRNKNN